MNILYFGDIFGKVGRRAVRHALPNLLAEYDPEFVVGNAENLAGGRGVNQKAFSEMIEMGFNVMTSGNHIWDHKEVYTILETDQRLLRPQNYPSAPDRCPGTGFGHFRNRGKELFVINVMGRVFMDNIDCPFQAVDLALKSAPAHVPILVDMHADATSEKYAMGFHLDGRVTAMVGSHSHVQTADERLLPKGTAYITDVGMSGSWDSIIGLNPPEIVRRFITKRPQKTQPARENPGVGCVIIQVDDWGRAKSIERKRIQVNLKESLDQGDLE